MQRKLGVFAGVLMLACLASAALPAAAQYTSNISGVATDQNGKPMADFLVLLKLKETGTTITVKTDKNGLYRQVGVRPGIYELTLKSKDKDQVIVQGLQCLVTGELDNRCDVDLRKLIAGETPEEEAARKKQEEDLKKFQNMKAAFTDGQTKVEEADQARAEMMKAPADQRAAMQPKVAGLYQEALHNFELAQQAAPDKDPNMHLVFAKQGYANEMLGNYDAAVADYQKAVELKPTSADYYNMLSLALARAGKVPEAMQACEKAASLDPAKGSTGWMNLGVVLYNSNHLAEAVEPLKKATALNPAAADPWYLLGASLLATMQTKQEGEKLTYVVTPGTAEAYQKYLQLAPNGRFAGEAKAALQALQSLGAGVDTKVKVKKGKG
jgi:tetratricopeptide (TPR) repeat protein